MNKFFAKLYRTDLAGGNRGPYGARWRGQHGLPERGFGSHEPDLIPGHRPESRVGNPAPLARSQVFTAQ
jgi:hypothetical protein